MNKLINRNTGQIVVYGEGIVDLKSLGCKNVAEFLEAGWEDYKEPKTFWAISWAGEPEEYDAEKTPQELKDMAKQIGNYFETKEEAEKVVEKLKVWERLKEQKEVKFEGWERNEMFCGDYTIKMTDQSTCDDKDLDLLFGGEDE